MLKVNDIPKQSRGMFGSQLHNINNKNGILNLMKIFITNCLGFRGEKVKTELL